MGDETLPHGDTSSPKPAKAFIKARHPLSSIDDRWADLSLILSLIGYSEPVSGLERPASTPCFDKSL